MACAGYRSGVKKKKNPGAAGAKRVPREPLGAGADPHGRGGRGQYGPAGLSGSWCALRRPHLQVA